MPRYEFEETSSANCTEKFLDCTQRARRYLYEALQQVRQKKGGVEEGFSQNWCRLKLGIYLFKGIEQSNGVAVYRGMAWWREDWIDSSEEGW